MCLLQSLCSKVLDSRHTSDSSVELNHTGTRTPPQDSWIPARCFAGNSDVYHLIENHWVLQNPERLPSTTCPLRPVEAGLPGRAWERISLCLWRMSSAGLWGPTTFVPALLSRLLVSLLQTPADLWALMMLGLLTKTTIPIPPSAPAGLHLCPSRESPGNR